MHIISVSVKKLLKRDVEGYMLKKLLLSLVVVTFSSVAMAQEEAVSIKENKPDVPKQEDMTAEEVLTISDNDFVIGKDDAPVTLVEYASMSCGHCANFHNRTFDDLKKKYIDTGKVKFVFRDFPLDEPALRGSMLARCAGLDSEGDFLKFIKTMFRTQPNWASKKNYLEVLSNIAKLGGMTGEAFEACMVNKDVEHVIMEGKFHAAKFLEIRSTPSFYINGELHRGAKDLKYLSEAIDAVLGGAEANVEIQGEPVATDTDAKKPE